MMGLTMSQRQAVTTAIATRYKRAGKADKGRHPGRVVRDDGVASQPRTEGADGSVDAEDRGAARPVRRSMTRILLRRCGFAGRYSAPRRVNDSRR